MKCKKCKSDTIELIAKISEQAGIRTTHRCRVCGDVVTKVEKPKPKK